MSGNKVISIINGFIGIFNIIIAVVSIDPKWYTIVCVGVSFLCAGLMWNMED